MISRIIEYSIRNRWLVILVWFGVALWGVYAVLHTPVDAIPDLSENQVIVFADWMGRSPQDIEEQVTYPLSVQLQGLAGVKAVRSSSEPNFSMVNIIFDERTDFYFARQRVLERLTTAQRALPAGVTPTMAADATALGQIFWYTVEGGGKSLDELRAIQDFTVRYQLNSIPGVAEVASVGGFVRQYQVDVDPNKLRVFNVPLSAVYSAISASNMSVGGKVLDQSSTEYLIRGIGWLRGVSDVESVVVTSRQGVPIHLGQVATVQLGPEFRRSALEKNGDGEAVGGVVMMRVGQNPLAVTEAIKQKIRDMQSGLPAAVRIVPFYDRTRLIESAIHTVTGTLREEIIIASLAILLILTHLRSALVVCITLPMAVLVAFLLMYYLNIPSNIMSLSGIAISIGILVDAAVVMVENASHELKAHFGDARVTGDTTEIVIRACRLVGQPIFFSVLIMLLSFLPVFTFGGQAGKLSHPLAFTKSFAMVGVALLAITLVPALVPLLVRGRLRGEEENWIVRSFIHIYRPVLSWMIDRTAVVFWMLGAIMLLAMGFLELPTIVTRIVLALSLMAVAWFASSTGLEPAALSPVSNDLDTGETPVLRKSRGVLAMAFAVLSLMAIAFIADTRFKKLGSEFMPELNEGSLMDMPLTAPRIAMGQAVDDVTVRDRLLRSFPEVEQAVGKIGRADTATDPSPVDMVETVVSLKPHELWPKRKIVFDDALKQARVVAVEMKARGWLKSDSAEALLNTATQIAVERFDRTMRELARRRMAEYEPELARQLVALAYDSVVKQARRLGALQREPAATQRDQFLLDHVESGRRLAQLPRQEELDRLLTAARDALVGGRMVVDRDDLLIDAPGVFTRTVNAVRRAVGAAPPGFSERVLDEVEHRREALWAERTKTLNWELFDFGKVAINDLLLDALYRSAVGTPHEGTKPETAALDTSRRALTDALAPRLFFWQKTKSDLQHEMDSELQMPGWGNVWTQPIINRVNMLATGVRTQIGVKVFGPTGKNLPDAIKDVQRVSEQIAAKLRTVRGAVDVTADQATGKRYVEITIDREKAGRYGVNMAELSQAVETAIGGGQVTMTVEGRQRFPVQVRYARAYWQDVDALGDVLVTGNATPANIMKLGPAGGATTPPVSSNMRSGAMGGASSESSAPPGGMNRAAAKEMPLAEAPPAGIMQIPLRMVADLRIADGPSMIKSENGRLRNYVTLNVSGRDSIGFVEEARAAIKSIEAQLAGTGMTIEWTGEFENQVRTRQTLAIIFPMVVALILLLLYFTFKDVSDMLLVALAVLGALSGAVMFQAIFDFNFSVIVSIGYIAAFGMATQTGVIMLVYLREAVDRRGGLQKISSLADLRQAVIEGAVHRLRPKLLTEGVAIVGLVPMLWATGTGAEIMRPMAAPVLGGLLISDEVIDLMIPVLFYWVRRRRWVKLHPENAPTVESSLDSRGRQPAGLLEARSV